MGKGPRVNKPIQLYKHFIEMNRTIAKIFGYNLLKITFIFTGTELGENSHLFKVPKTEPLS